MEIGPSLVADGQPPEAGEPGEGTFHHPAMLPQPLAGVDALAGDAGLDVPSTALSGCSLAGRLRRRRCG